MPRRVAGCILASFALVGCADLSSLTGRSTGDAAAESGREGGATSVVCPAGRSVSCTGPGGCTGGQACNAAGTAYEPCVCETRDSEAGTSDPVPAARQSQTVSLVAASSTVTITLPGAIAAADTLIVPVVNDSDSIQVSSVSGGGGVWARAAGPLSVVGHTGTAEIWYAPNVSAGGGAVTITFSAPLVDFGGGMSGVATLSAWGGMEVTPFDSAGSTQGTGATSFTTSPLTPSVPNELFISVASTQRYGADLVYGSWTELDEFASMSGGYADAAFLVASGSGAQRAAGTEESGQYEGWAALIAGFK